MKPRHGMNSLFDWKVYPRFSYVVSRAIKEKTLMPKPCEVCGYQGLMVQSNGIVKRAISAHHPDYNKPLNVTWLCRAHHFVWHTHFEPIHPAKVVAGMTPKPLYEYGLKVLRGELQPYAPEPVAVILNKEAKRKEVTISEPAK